MDSAYISALAALAGSSIGALATFATTWLNQSYQHRIQRRSDERARRERLFGDFINEAAKTYTDAMANRLDDPSRLVDLYAIKSRISLFSNEEVLREADKVLQAIVHRYFSEKIRYTELDPNAANQFDLLGDFTRSCRKELTKY